MILRYMQINIFRHFLRMRHLFPPKPYAPHEYQTLKPSESIDALYSFIWYFTYIAPNVFYIFYYQQLGGNHRRVYI